MWKKISPPLYLDGGETLNLFQVLSSHNAREKFVLIYQMAYQAQGSPAQIGLFVEVKCNLCWKRIRVCEIQKEKNSIYRLSLYQIFD
jgi:hypothetical protein